MKPKTLADAPIYTRLSPEDMAEFERVRAEGKWITSGKWNPTVPGNGVTYDHVVISRSELARELISRALALKSEEDMR